MHRQAVCFSDKSKSALAGQMLCCLCLILLEDGRLNAVPGLLKEISSDRHMSDHPRSEGTVLFLKAIYK